MRLLAKGLLVLAISVGTGLLVDKAVLHRSSDRGTPLAQLRLTAAMAGLFGGGAAGTVVALALAFRKS